MGRTTSQFDFFKKVCLDDNGLLCGIQDVIDGLQNITTVVSGNTTAINNIDINVQSINEEMVEVNSNIEELNGIVGEIQTCVCPPSPPQPPTPTPTPTPTPKKKCCCKPRNCKPRPPRCPQNTKSWGGWTIVVDRRYPDKYYPKQTYTPPPQLRTLPLLQIPYGFENVDGTWTDRVPPKYIDSKGKIITVRAKGWVGQPNKSQAYKQKPGATYTHWKPIR